jgi:ATP phosphoribosyltransferase
MTSNDMDYLTIALPKGKLFSLSSNLLAKVGYSAEGLSEKSRKLVITNEEKKIKFIITKTADVPTYVEYGAADIGIIGKDVLMEAEKDVYELLDLGFGRCHLMMAVHKATKRENLSDYAHTRVATKFPKTAEKFFNSKGMQMEFIKNLDGLRQVRVAIRAKQHISIAFKGRKCTIGSALHAYFRPKIIITQNSFQNTHTATELISKLRKIGTFADILYLA